MPEVQSTKLCFKCQQTLPAAEFFKDRTNKSGLQSRCKNCCKRYDLSAAGRAAHKKYYASELGRAANRRSNGKYIKLHPDRMKARRAISIAIHSGKLTSARTLKCFHCGARAKEYHHHRGYAVEHWLDVLPLCKRCHDVLG